MGNRKKKSIILIIILVILIISLIIGLIMPFSASSPFDWLASRTSSFINSNTVYAENGNNTSNPGLLKEDGKLAPFNDKIDEYKDLKKQNSDYVGWLYVKGTKVDYPVMQTPDDPHYYLYRDFDKSDLFEGTLFINENSNIDEPSDVIFVYGHDMRNGNKFGEFDLFLDQNYLKENNHIVLDSMSERREFEITHVIRVRVNVPEGDPFPYYTYDHFANETDFNEFMAQVEEYQIYDTGAEVKYGDKFVMMTTCEYTWADGTGRLVLLGTEKAEEKYVTPVAIKEPETLGSTSMLIMLIALGVALLIILLVSIPKIRAKRK